jgi:O-antigen/teichoic acid export membrane protein
MSDHNSHLLSGRILAASAFWSLAAQAIPAIVGLVAIPFIVRGLGVERFGVLTLAWMVIGYFGLFDLGLGRAVTKLAAELLTSAKRSKIDPLVWTTWYLMLALGFVGAVVLAAITPWLVGSAIKVPPDLHRETLQAFYLLAWSIPIVVLTAGFRGLLEAAQQFKLTSLVKIPMGALTFIAPLLVLQFTPNLAVIVLTLIAVRLAGAIAYAVMCHRAVHHHGTPPPFDRSAARALLGFGAWMTVSNVVSPLMVSVDRFFVGAFLSIAAVAYYATPYEAVTKFLIIPSAIAAVLFPAFSTASVVNAARIRDLFRTGMQVVFLSMYPIVFVVITFAPELLRIWLGGAFAVQSAPVLRWLALGVLMNSLASLPFALLQGIGRSDTTAKIHLTEVPIYLVLMVWLIQRYGITGAAIAWSARTTLDMALLYGYAYPHLGTAGSGRLRDITIFATMTAALGAGLLLRTPLQKVLLASILLISCAALAWAAVNGRRTRIAPIPERLS